MNYNIQPCPPASTIQPPARVGTGPKEISAGKSFASNSFEAFLPKDWEKKAKEGYQALVSLGLRPPSDTFPPPLELYKEWNERRHAEQQRVATQDRQARYRENHKEELAAKERDRRQK